MGAQRVPERSSIAKELAKLRCRYFYLAFLKVKVISLEKMP